MKKEKSKRFTVTLKPSYVKGFKRVNKKLKNSTNLSKYLNNCLMKFNEI